MALNHDMDGGLQGRKVGDLTSRAQRRKKMTKERKMGAQNSACGDFMGACNLLSRKTAAEKESERAKTGVKEKIKIQKRALVVLISKF